MKREQLYVSDQFSAEFDELYLRYRRGELKVPAELKGRRLTRNLILLIGLDAYFRGNHNFSSRPFGELSNTSDTEK